MAADDHQSTDISYETEGLTEESKTAYQNSADALLDIWKSAFVPNPPGTGSFNTKRRKARRLRAKGKKRD